MLVVLPLPAWAASYIYLSTSPDGPISVIGTSNNSVVATLIGVTINPTTRTIVGSFSFSTTITIGPTLAITPDRACGEDFTSQTLIAKSAFAPFIFPQLQSQFVTVVNAGGFIPPFFAGSSMRGPITLFLNNIQNGIFVGNNATSTCYSPGGAYTVVSAGPDNVFGQAEPIIVPLLFFKTGPGPITYNVRVVSGTPGQ